MEKVAEVRTLDSLPKVVFYIILNHLQESDINNIAVLSKYFNDLIKNAPWRGFEYREAHKNSHDFVVKTPKAKNVDYQRAFQIPGKRVILLRSDLDIDLWSCGNEKEKEKPKRLCKLTSITAAMSAFTYHKEKLIVGCDNGLMFVFNVNIDAVTAKKNQLVKIKPTLTLEHHAENSVTTITPVNETQIASGDNNGNIKCWNIDTGKLDTSYAIKDELIMTIRVKQVKEETRIAVVTEIKKGYQEYHLEKNEFKHATLHIKWPHGQSGELHRTILHPSGRLTVFKLEFDENGFYKDDLCVTSCTYKKQLHAKDKRRGRTTHNTFYWDLNDKDGRSNYYAGVSPFQGRVTFFYPENNTVRVVSLDRVPFENNRAPSNVKLMK